MTSYYDGPPRPSLAVVYAVTKCALSATHQDYLSDQDLLPNIYLVTTHVPKDAASSRLDSTNIQEKKYLKIQLPRRRKFLAR